jgi:hypothetical protein
MSDTWDDIMERLNIYISEPGITHFTSPAATDGIVADTNSDGRPPGADIRFAPFMDADGGRASVRLIGAVDDADVMPYGDQVGAPPHLWNVSVIHILDTRA